MFRQVEEKDAQCVCPSEIFSAVLASLMGRFLTWVALESNTALTFLRGNVINYHLLLTEKEGLWTSAWSGVLRTAAPQLRCLRSSASQVFGQITSTPAHLRLPTCEAGTPTREPSLNTYF